MSLTSIEWADYTFNPWIGCAKVAAGCRNCYAERNMVVTMGAAKGTWGKDARRHVTSDVNWRKPLQWAKKARMVPDPEWEGGGYFVHGPTPSGAGESRVAASQWVRPRVFCASLADVFEDRPDLVEPRGRLFSLINSTPELDWLLLTKRPENLLRMIPWHGEAMLRNVWLGTSVACQEDADRNIPELLKVPAAVRFVSYEPAIGPVSFGGFVEGEPDGDPRIPGDATGVVYAMPGLDWVIVGGESGKEGEARPCDVAWIRSAVEQCHDASVPVFVKQLGSVVEDRGAAEIATHFPREQCWPDDVCERVAYGQTRIPLQHPKGGDPAEWPEDLRVREFPRRD